jgi:hypothetical protein
MMLYKIMLCLVVFGAVNGAIDSLQIYSYKTPQQEVGGIGQAEVTDLSNTMSGAPLNPFTAYFVLTTIIRVLGSAALALLTVIPFLMAWGIPFAFALMIQTPIWLVMAWGFYEMWTGHTPPAQD